ncbi:hypothetical protein FSP39_012213 [Pinctada imbricata]|uniref:Apoptosis inhibitor 5 n=1 Tax=Pinctada imbricata TaxID=66713 RepID=A0AA88YCZ5_PINIB|nr:hypothetical protein FSP39_012213 [Pinctada imbricata]
MIRKQAIKDLPNLCKNSPESVAKIAEALTQLLQCDDQGELSLIQSSLKSLFGNNAKGTLEGIFAQILGEDDAIREKAIKFLGDKVKTLPEDTIDKDCEDYLVTMCKKVLQDVTKDEFIAIMDILKCQRSMITVQGRQQLVEIVTEQAELDQPFDAEDADCVDRLVHCVKQAAPLFSKNVHSKAFFGYMCDHVLPNLQKIASPEEGVDGQLEILKLCAEISEFCGDLDKLEERVANVYNCLIHYMPLPPAEENDGLSANEEPKLSFSLVECLMFSFHQIGRKLPGFLADEENAERLKDFKSRLQYFARGVQVYIKTLRAALQGKTGETLKTEENKIKVVALKITSNINTLIKDLFHSPPSYKAVVTLSWKPLVSKPAPATATAATAGQKRFTPVSFETNGASGGKKAHKQERSLYAPPSGKFSEKAGTFQPGQGRGGRGGFRGRRY